MKPVLPHPLGYLQEEKICSGFEADFLKYLWKEKSEKTGLKTGKQNFSIASKSKGGVGFSQGL